MMKLILLNRIDQGWKNKLPVCHLCKKNNLYSDVVVYAVKENVGTTTRPRYRICDICAHEYPTKLHILAIFYPLGLRKKTR